MMRLAAVLSGFLLLTGCGGDDPPAPAPTPAPTPTPAPSPTPQPTPVVLDLGDGLKAEVLEPGTGSAAAAEGDTVLLGLRILDAAGAPQWEGTMEVTLGSGEGYAALDRTVTGMTEGARRRAEVPPGLTWPGSEKATTGHTLEVHLQRLTKAEAP